MKNITTIIAALLFATSATFASINIDVDTKADKIEIQSTDSKVHEVVLNRVEGAAYNTNIEVPSDNLSISTKLMQRGMYFIQARDLNGNKTSQFINVN